jgi:signal transduction histidine kinase
VSVRLRFALLYSGAFLVSGLVVLSVAFLSTSSTQHVGSTSPPVVRHPVQASLGPLADIIVVLVVLVALSVAFGWLLASRLLRPVRLMTAAARDISASNLSRRLRPGRRDDEFARLADTLNDLFARLEAAFAAQRRFVANASHELRTPLAAERTLLQVALADPEADTASLREACEQVLALGVRTERLIDALLTLATGERGIERREPFDLADLAGHVVGPLTREAACHGVRLDATLGPAPATGDPRLAESLIANLADNALRHNTPGGWAEISTATRDGDAVVSVRNSGPVIPPQEVDRLFRPFQRLGTERTGRSGGHGLGLAIVSAIADAHGGQVTAAARDSGGLDIDVVFPSRALLRRQWLAQPQVVAAGVADGGVADAVGLVDGLLEDLRPGGAQFLEGLVEVVDLDEDRQVALGDDLAHRQPVGRGNVVVDGGQQQVVGATGGADGEPAHLRAHRDVVMDLEAEPLRVEGERLVEVSAVHGRVRDGKCHVGDPTRGRPGPLLQSCTAARSTPAGPRRASCTAGPA